MSEEMELAIAHDEICKPLLLKNVGAENSNREELIRALRHSLCGWILLEATGIDSNLGYCQISSERVSKC